MKAALALLGCCGLLAGCAVNGAGNSCDLGTEMTVSPASATADHAAAPPGNTAQFTATVAPTAPRGCPLPAWLLRATPTWTSSDAKDVTIDSSSGPTNGTATCVGATTGAATLTATFVFDSKTLTQTASLTCK